MKVRQVLELYEIRLENTELLNNNLTYPVILINKKYVLKRVPSEIVVNEVLFDIGISKCVINGIVKNKYGRIFSYYDSCFWVLTRYIEGEVFQHSQHRHLIGAVEFLREFQKTNLNNGEIRFHDNFSVENWYKNSERLYSKTLSLMDYYYGEVDSKYLKRLRSMFNRLSFEEDYTQLKLTLSHGEYQNTNILFNQDQLHMIDFDSLSIRPRIFDIVNSACYLCRIQRGDFEIDKSKLNTYLLEFQLTEIERKNLLNMIFISFVPKEDTIEKFFVFGHDNLRWYLNWTLSAMEKLFDFFEEYLN